MIGSAIKAPKRDGYWLVYQHSIVTDVRRGAAAKYATEFLEAAGYRQSQSSPTMIFQRGWQLAGLFNPNPKRQQTIIHMDLVSSGAETLIEMTMRVNCIGNRPLSKDLDFWQAELNGIQEAIEVGYANPLISTYAAERALWYNVVILICVLLLVLVALFGGIMTLLIMAVL